jgi:ribosomal protein S26
VSCLSGSFAFGVVQVRASQGRRERHTGPYADRGERREVRAWAARNVKIPGRHDTNYAPLDKVEAYASKAS